MFTRPFIKQTIPPASPRETLPTMYDLPSEDPEEPGLPDEYHDLQPELLSRTLYCPFYPPERLFMGTDINLYYDVHHTRWYKRPNWFLVLGVSRLYDGTDLRASYVVWQEGANPFVVVELLSPKTAREDLGETTTLELGDDGTEDLLDSDSFEAGELLDNEVNAATTLDSEPEVPPRKWDVYERILRVPYYIVFSRYTNRLRFFQLVGGHYQEQILDSVEPKIWLPELALGLGLWQGEYRGIERLWLRWYDVQGWVLTDTEQEQQRANQAEQRAAQLAERLRAAGINPDE